MRRYLPFALIALVLLFGAQALFKRKATGPTSPSATAAKTITAINLIDRDEQAYKAVSGRYTSNLADLLQLKPHLANDVVGLSVQLDASTDGGTYLAQVASNVLSLTRAFNETKLTSQSCVILKSGSGATCPAPAR
jgi:hypothetical protein